MLTSEVILLVSRIILCYHRTSRSDISEENTLVKDYIIIFININML